MDPLLWRSACPRAHGGDPLRSRPDHAPAHRPARAVPPRAAGRAPGRALVRGAGRRASTGAARPTRCRRRRSSLRDRLGRRARPTSASPRTRAAPVVQVGTGQTDYLPVTAGQTVQMEQGPQGGHHVWIAVRQRNLKQSGSTTTITSVVPSDRPRRSADQLRLHLRHRRGQLLQAVRAALPARCRRHGLPRVSRQSRSTSPSTIERRERRDRHRRRSLNIDLNFSARQAFRGAHDHVPSIRSSSRVRSAPRSPWLLRGACSATAGPAADRSRALSPRRRRARASSSRRARSRWPPNTEIQDCYFFKVSDLAKAAGLPTRSADQAAPDPDRAEGRLAPHEHLPGDGTIVKLDPAKGAVQTGVNGTGAVLQEPELGGLAAGREHAAGRRRSTGRTPTASPTSSSPTSG